MESTRTCETCMEKRKGECFGKSSICEDYRYSPSMLESDKKAWPHMMKSSRLYNQTEKMYRQTSEEVSRIAQYAEVNTEKNENLIRTVYSLNEVDIYKYIKNNKSDVIIIGYGGVNQSTQIGYYKFGLVYKMKMLKIEGVDCGALDSCVLKGIYDSIKRINNPSSIVVITDTTFWFGDNSQKISDWNVPFLNKIYAYAEMEKKSTLKMFYVDNATEKIEKLIDSATTFFNVIRHR